MATYQHLKNGLNIFQMLIGDEITPSCNQAGVVGNCLLSCQRGTDCVVVRNMLHTKKPPKL
jgi:hypothetical protein